MSAPADVDIDFGRQERIGFPEIVYGEFKSAEQLDRLIDAHAARRTGLLVTRVAAERLPADRRGGQYDPLSRTFRLGAAPAAAVAGSVAVVSAGTSDAAVVAEAMVTLEFLGVRAAAVQDVGVAGLHRLLARLPDIAAHDVVIVVAGFEGALPSVVAGLLPQPVIAVPAAVGYGVAAGGRVALEAMLASCANGVLVTNIDNGCGAAMAARRMLQRRPPA